MWNIELEKASFIDKQEFERDNVRMSQGHTELSSLGALGAGKVFTCIICLLFSYCVSSFPSPLPKEKQHKLGVTNLKK